MIELRGMLRVLPLCGLVAMGGCAGAARMEEMSTMTSMSGTMLSDPNIAAIAHASNMDEIQTSQAVLQRSQNAQVRQFAQQMVTEHTAADGRMTQMLQAKGMTMQPEATATRLMQATQQTVASLNSRSGMDLDRTYMAHQVQAHQWTLTSLDRTLIPGARDPEMKAFLANTVRPAVAMHLQMAQRMLAGMGGGAGTGNNQ
jgi:putative membrane protein